VDAGALKLQEPLPPVTRRQQLVFLLLWAGVAMTRWPAVSATLWDWDEALFALAVRDYDVTAHHPHPPGFPLFIALARMVALTGLDEFHALQVLTVASSLFLFPAMVFLARELRLPSDTALCAGAVLAFFPNVWFFGGTAFSDVPSMVLAATACALLLRGCRSSGAFLSGALVLGLAAGLRPQNLLIAAVPFLLAAWCRRRAALAAMAIVAVVVAASYGGAAAASGGWDSYRETLTRHEQYIRATDSFLAPRHPGLVQVADDFFLRPYRAPVINVLVPALAVIALLRRRGGLALACFGPFLLFAWLYLDFHSASRFSIAYMPLFAVLAPLGLPDRVRAAGTGVLVAVMAVWTWPALRVVHTTASPPVAAIEAVRAMPHRGPLLVDERLAAHAALLLPDVQRKVVRVAPPFVVSPGTVLLREGASAAPGAKVFTRERARLSGIARPRYFEVSILQHRQPTTDN
jgi:hypothetical protein